MKRALIVVNAYSRLPSSLNQAERLKAEFSALGVTAEIRRNDLNFCIKGGNVCPESSGYDFAVYLDKDKYTARMLESGGLRLFNSCSAVEACDDKMLTHLALAGRGVPMPDTVAGRLCYTADAEPDERFLKSVADFLGYPVVVKECYGSLGKGVYLAKDFAALLQISEKVKMLPHLYQKFVSSGAGRDIRVIVIGGKCVAAMERRSRGDFRSNLELGGEGLPYSVDGGLEGLCLKAADILKLDYCGIDVLFGESGYLLCEVNSNAFFGGIERVTGVNVAKIYAEYIYREVY